MHTSPSMNSAKFKRTQKTLELQLRSIDRRQSRELEMLERWRRRTEPSLVEIAAVYVGIGFLIYFAITDPSVIVKLLNPLNWKF